MDPNKLIQYIGHEYDLLLSNSGSAMLYDIDGRWVYCGSVTDYSSLPNYAQAGDVYYISSLGTKYFYNGTTWEPLGDTVVSVPVDNALSTTSTNPVQNKVITAKLNDLDDEDEDLQDQIDTLETAAKAYYKDSSWSDSTRTIEFTKSDGTTKSHIIPTGNDACYTSSAWDETYRNLTLTKGDGTNTVHNIKLSESSAGVLTFVTTSGDTVVKRVISSSETPYTLCFELADGTLVNKTIVSETTG